MNLLLKQTKPGDLPYVGLYHGTHLYNFLIDTGSTSNWIDPETMSNFMQEGETKVNSRVLNGQKCAVFTATLRVEPRRYDETDDTAYKFSASFANDFIPNLQQLNENTDCEIHGILGMEFLQSNHIVINLKSLVLVA